MCSKFASPVLMSLLLFWTGLSVFAEEPSKLRQSNQPHSLPSLDEALAAGTDVWGEAAMARPGGPSYEFFARLLPPLRYVRAEFRHYPIPLSAPRAANKARLISNGSAINAKAGGFAWHDVGFPVNFLVGKDRAAFGEDLDRLDGPRYAKGYLPIVEMRYREGEATYRQETFAATRSPLKEHAAVFVRLSFEKGKQGEVVARIDTQSELVAVDGVLRDESGKAYVAFDKSWQWEPRRKELIASLTPESPALLTVLTRPAENVPANFLTAEAYQEEQQACRETWQTLLDRGVRLEVPERVVNNAWRSLLIGNEIAFDGNKAFYSVANQYANQYVTEGNWPLRACLMYGYIDETQPMVEVLLDLRKAPVHRYAISGWKLRMLAFNYWYTRDYTYIEANRSRWEPLVKLIVGDLLPENGLVPKDGYASDLHNRLVYNLKTNACCWRGLRDMAAVLRDAGHPDPELEKRTKKYRQDILDAVAKNERHDVDPPFIPNNLFGKEKTPERLTESTVAWYWNLISNDLLCSGLFDIQPEKSRWIRDYVHKRGGLCMGMLRNGETPPIRPLFDKQRVDDLYTLGYAIYMLRHDDVDRALVCFYGKLAQGLTPETFIGGEGTVLPPHDKYGRAMYLPPNTGGNGYFLQLLRYLLVQDWDLDDDGKPETLRLLFATPRRWLRDGAKIKLEDAPTAFGKLSINVESKLAEGEIVAKVSLPPRQPEHTLLRARVPRGWKVVSASVGDVELPVDERGTVDLSKRKGRITVRFQVGKTSDEGE